ncbi:X-Pro dipeptidyl-peptidase protein [Colletotrichum fioriniae PJ7]|uniref:X-Pro dipeptidyl-peptidase protein n=1 Tax=Colletotrichum fioriniae PJ7 TaxID=1445577 RepID=A0A010RXD3_9PEZI|nr:X-Pro dipeptidyl-peptidase protein [Colletotrichum fioriniae PJ7]
MFTERTVQYLSRGITVFADLYLPGPEAPDRSKAAVIIGHPGTGIKEQASRLYACLLAESGFVALAFDAAYQGESGGEPRNLEDPYQRVEDFKSAVTFLSLLPGEVDPERIGVVGICASGGFGIFAAQTDVRMKAVAGVVPMCIGAQSRAAFRDESGKLGTEALAGSLRYAADCRIAEARGAQPSMIRITDVFPEAKEYYESPSNRHPRCTNEQLSRSMELALNYDSYAFIELIAPRPLLLISATIPQQAFNTAPYIKAAYERASKPKTLVLIEGARHIDLYSNASQSGPALVEFMSRWLC